MLQTHTQLNGKPFECSRCLDGTEFYFQPAPKSNHIGIYCASCNKWHKWASNSERQQYIRTNNTTPEQQFYKGLIRQKDDGKPPWLSIVDGDAEKPELTFEPAVFKILVETVCPECRTHQFIPTNHNHLTQIAYSGDSPGSAQQYKATMDMTIHTHTCPTCDTKCTVQLIELTEDGSTYEINWQPSQRFTPGDIMREE